LKNRSCTDIICLLIFALYVGFMTYLFVYGLVVGDLQRVTSGYDAAGNVCGQKDNEAVENVPQSGRDMEAKPFLYFDLVRTARIVGGESLNEVRDDLGDQTLTKVEENYLDFCLEGETEAANVEALEKESKGVVKLRYSNELMKL